MEVGVPQHFAMTRKMAPRGLRSEGRHGRGFEGGNQSFSMAVG